MWPLSHCIPLYHSCSPGHDLFPNRKLYPEGVDTFIDSRRDQVYDPDMKLMDLSRSVRRSLTQSLRRQEDGFDLLYHGPDDLLIVDWAGDEHNLILELSQVE
jgi:hypothetical protein